MNKRPRLTAQVTKGESLEDELKGQEISKEVEAQAVNNTAD